MKNKKWFTLLEVLLSIIILWAFIGTIINIFLDIKWADWKMVNKRLLTAEASDLIDKIHEAAIEYTIDYEEYFNKQMSNFWWGDTFTTYWNEWKLYYCINSSSQSTVNNKYTVYPRKTENNWYWCPQQWNQKYLEYYFQHFKLNNINVLNSKENSWAYQWLWPVAIIPNTWIDYLYLISEDWTERYYFRRLFKEENDINGDTFINWKNERLFTVQMLKLKWLDAWTWHDYDSWWAYDWFIDTRVCDSAQWFYCSWAQVWNKNDRLPANEDDWRIDITDEKITVSDMKIDLYPVKDPYLAINDSDYRNDPYAKISFTMNMYWIESTDEITITTSYSFKNSYSKFPTIKYQDYICDKTECK